MTIFKAPFLYLPVPIEYLTRAILSRIIYEHDYSEYKVGEEYDAEVGEGRGTFTWADKNGIAWWANNSKNPEILEYQGKIFLYGESSYRKQSLNELIRVK